MKKWHMIVDLAKCVGCYNCLLACKDEHVGNSWLPYTDSQQLHEDKWINPERVERGCVPYTEVAFVTKTCQHCDDAPCAKKCPEAVIKRPDGIVLLDPARAKGNKALAEACPYGSIHWNEELQTAQKCTMCAHLLDDGWKEPRCVQACPLRALSVVYCDDIEFEQMVEKQKLKPLTDGSNRPRVLYRNLYKANKCFIAGAISYMDGEIEKAATEAKIKLSMNGVTIKEVYADFLGEFKIDRLPQNSGTYTVEVSMPGYISASVDVEIKTESPSLGCIKLERA
jgi:Fe-S-cluster-containing dehydrogenase component